MLSRTSYFEGDVMFSRNWPCVACAVGSIYVTAVLEQLVTNFRCIHQEAPRCLTLSWYTMAASSCAPGGGVIAMTTYEALSLVGGLQRAV